MPFRKDSGIREENEKYCSLCFKNGVLCYKGTDVKEFQKVVKEVILRRGTNPIKAWFLIKTVAFAPRWREK